MDYDFSPTFKLLVRQVVWNDHRLVGRDLTDPSRHYHQVRTATLIVLHHQVRTATFIVLHESNDPRSLSLTELTII